jgi:hypothetical protein
LKTSNSDIFIALPNIRHAPNIEHFEPMFKDARIEIAEDNATNLSIDIEAPNRPYLRKETVEPSRAN